MQMLDPKKFVSKTFYFILYTEKYNTLHRVLCYLKMLSCRLFWLRVDWGISVCSQRCKFKKNCILCKKTLKIHKKRTLTIKTVISELMYAIK